METKANHVLVGAFTLATILAALLFTLWASRFVSDAAWSDYEVVFTGTVTGLSEGGSVRFNGIPVGTVRQLLIDPDYPGRVIARIRVEQDTPINTDTTAQLRLSGMTGITFILLIGGSPDSPPLVAGDGASAPRIMADSSALDALVSASEDIAAKTAMAVERVLTFLSEDNARNVSESLANLEQFTALLSEQRGAMERIVVQLEQGSNEMVGLVQSAQRLTATTEQSVTRIDGVLVDTLPALSGDLQTAAQALSESLARIDRVLAENEGALATFGTEGLSQLGPTLQELRILVRDLSRLSARFERNPANFLLGRETLKEYQPE